MMCRHKQPKIYREEGFTLVELLVVLVILGLIAGIAVPQVMNYVGGAKSKSAAIQIERLSTILDLFYLDVGRYPNADEGLQVLLQNPADVATWKGPYVKTEQNLVDPWGRPYAYNTPGKAHQFDLYSLGADGEEGGTGENADITLW